MLLRPQTRICSSLCRAIEWNRPARRPAASARTAQTSARRSHLHASVLREDTLLHSALASEPFALLASPHSPACIAALVLLGLLRAPRARAREASPASLQPQALPAHAARGAFAGLSRYRCSSLCSNRCSVAIPPLGVKLSSLRSDRNFVPRQSDSWFDSQTGLRPNRSLFFFFS